MDAYVILYNEAVARSTYIVGRSNLACIRALVARQRSPTQPWITSINGTSKLGFVKLCSSCFCKQWFWINSTNTKSTGLWIHSLLDHPCMLKVLMFPTQWWILHKFVQLCCIIVWFPKYGAFGTISSTITFVAQPPSFADYNAYNPYFGYNGALYPYPSYVNVANFVKITLTSSMGISDD